ncbi:MAG: YibE/F family protein [Actinomycetota bacterium]|nr:YibE/F family protein [Actinomycetota bacterium]
MGAGHSHRAGDDFEVPRVRRLVLLWALGLTAVVTVVGVVLLWPDGGDVDDVQESVSFAAPGVTFPEATVDDAEPACADLAPSDDCGAVSATISEGDDRGKEVRVAVPPEVSESGLQKGDTIRIISTPETDASPHTYSYFGTGRSGTLWVLAILFVVVVLAVARLRGLFALVGLGFTAVVAWTFMLPALLVGESPLLVALAGCSAIMFVVLFTTHGVSIRTSAALAGTLLGVALTAGLGAVFVGASRLTGVADESGSVLRSYVDNLGFQGLLTCAVVIAGLGVLNDVTITQASSVFELRAAAPAAARRHLFASAMRIGRDHIASAIYTILFAYAGTALLVLLVLQLYGLPMDVLLSTEEIAQEVVRSLVTSLGLVLAVPITTAIAAITVPGARARAA